MLVMSYNNTEFCGIDHLPDIVDSAASAAHVDNLLDRQAAHKVIHNRLDKSTITKGHREIQEDLSTDAWKTLITFFCITDFLGEFSTLSTISTIRFIYLFYIFIMKEYIDIKKDDTSFSIKKMIRWKFITIITLNTRRCHMQLYGGIDLHSTNNYIGIIDEQDRRVYKKKLPNNLELILTAIEPFKTDLIGIVVESTFNWYWLVDGLMENGYRTHLANPAAIKQYEGLKYSDDTRDSFWLAHMLRLNILAEGYIYPKEERPLRDLLRKRGRLVRQKTSHILSFKSMVSRNLGSQISGDDVKKLKEEDVEKLFKQKHLIMAGKSSIAIIQFLTKHIRLIEKEVRHKIKVREPFARLLTVPGIGDIIALHIMLEVGNIGRFPEVGNYSSYCRCVTTSRLSNGKKKGKGNSKNGNKYLGWAYVEAANYAKRFCPYAQKFYQRKKAKTNGSVAIKALSNKLARATYYIMRDKEEYAAVKLFG